MGSEWRTVSVADVAEVISGGTPPTSKPEYWGGEVPWLSVADFNSAYRWVSEAEKHITKRALDETSTTLLNSQDIIVSARGTIGAIAQLARPMAFNQSCYGLRAKKGIADTDFLYYALRNLIATMKRVSHGAVFETITRDTFRVIKFLLPPLPVQRAIACILGSLDDKIELNRRMNRTLEEMARAIFKSWFIDFEPVRAKAAVRRQHPKWTDEQVSRAACPNLKPEIARLFPDSFENSELGEIPKGWRVKTIGDLAEIVGGSTPRTTETAYWDRGTHAWATPKDLSKLSVPVLLKTERQITDEGLAQISSGLLPVGTVLLSSRAPIGYLAIAEVPVAINQGFIAMKPRERVSNLYLLFWARSAHDEIVSRANGSTFLEISKSSFRPIPIVAPPPEVFAAFDRVAKSFFARLVSNEYESRSLAALRDTLLPKLLSGELRIKDAEKFLKARGL